MILRKLTQKPINYEKAFTVPVTKLLDSAIC